MQTRLYTNIDLTLQVMMAGRSFDIVTAGVSQLSLNGITPRRALQNILSLRDNWPTPSLLTMCQTCMCQKAVDRFKCLQINTVPNFVRNPSTLIAIGKIVSSLLI